MRSRASVVLGFSLRLSLFVALAGAAVVMRFTNLDARPLMHDESMFAFYSFDAMQKMGARPAPSQDGTSAAREPVYTHMPIMHGPTMMLAAGALFHLPWLGDSIKTARGMVAALSLLALASVVALWPRRMRWCLVPLLVASPMLLFWSRFFRDDMIFCALLAAGVLGVSRGMQKGRWRSAWAVAGVVSMFALLTVMENALFAYAAAATFGALVLGLRAARALGLRRALRGLRPRPVRRRRPQRTAGDALGLLKKRAAAEPFDPERTLDGEERIDLQESVATQVALLEPERPDEKPTLAGPAAVPAWKERAASILRWSAAVLCGLALIALVYGHLVGQASVDTSSLHFSGKRKFLRYLRASGWANLWASWQYWEGQHSIQRISGPLHYHLPILALYELPMLLLLYAGIAWDSLLRRWRAILYGGAMIAWLALWFVWHRFVGAPAQGNQVGLVGKALNFLHLEPSASLLALGTLIVPMLVWSVLKLVDRRPLAAWAGWWAACSMFQYSVAGEKVPWLAIHMALPMYVMLAWVWAPLLRNRSRLAFAAFAGFALAGAAVGLRSDLRFLDERAGDPRERLVYNHTSIELDKAIKSRLSQWEAKSAQIPLKERKVMLADDAQLGGPSWPGYWYFRHCGYVTTVEPLTLMDRPWDLILATSNAIQPQKLDRGLWRVQEMSLRDHWWAPWPEEAAWDAWLSGRSDSPGDRRPSQLLKVSLDLLWTYYWDRAPWSSPGGFPIALVEPPTPR